MPVARAAAYRPSVSDIFRGREDELDVELRKAIMEAVFDYDPARASFPTFVYTAVKHNIVDWIRKESRFRHLGIVLDKDDPRFGLSPDGVARIDDERGTTPRGARRQLRVPFPEAQWAGMIDWGFAIQAAEMALGPEYGDYAVLRAGGFSQRETAERLGVSHKRVRKIEGTFLAWYRSTQGREAAVLRKEKGNEHGADAGADGTGPGRDRPLPAAS